MKKPFTDMFAAAFKALVIKQNGIPTIDENYVRAMLNVSWVPDDEDLIRRLAAQLNVLALRIEKPRRPKIPEADAWIAAANDQPGDRRSASKRWGEKSGKRQSPMTATRQLEPPVGDFVGRKDKKDELISGLMRHAGVGIGMIHGMPGVGKTQLALLAAQELQADFPDAQLLVKLRGGDGTPSSPCEALANTIRSLKGFALELPPDIASLRQIYLSSLRGTKSFVLVDNAAETSDVEWLVPPDGGTMIVTSRAPIALHRGVTVTVSLGELLPEEAVTLLVGICGRVPLPVAERICRYCGYLPLAIRAAGNLLATTLDLDPALYATELEDEHHRLERIGSTGVPIGVEASFNLSYVRLATKTATVFQSLAVFPASFEISAEAAICDDPANEHLRVLVRQALVNFENGSFRSHKSMEFMQTG